MARNLAEKEAVIDEVAAVARTAYSAIAAEYRGLTVTQLTDLRSRARQSGVYMRVVKNTLARRALDGTGFACMQDGLTGPLVLAFSREDPGAAARVVRDFIKADEKKNDKLVVRVVALDGKLLAPTDVLRLASLPTREQALGMLLGLMKAPVGKLVRTINEVPGKLVRTVAAIRDSKQAA